MDFGTFLYEKTADEIPTIWQPLVTKYVESAELELTYSRRELNKTLNWIIGEWRLELANEDWRWIKERGGMSAMSRTLKELADRTWEGALYWVEKDFGYEERDERRPQNQGEALGRKLWEVFERTNEDFFMKMGQDRRASEFAKSKVVAKKFTFDIEKWIRFQITRAGYK